MNYGVILDTRGNFLTESILLCLEIYTCLPIFLLLASRVEYISFGLGKYLLPNMSHLADRQIVMWPVGTLIISRNNTAVKPGKHTSVWQFDNRNRRK